MKKKISLTTGMAAAPAGLVFLLVIFACLLLSSSAAAAQCDTWDIRKVYAINQANNIVVKFDNLIRRGPRISGTASFHGKTRLEKGTISGGTKGDGVTLEIKWDYGETGVYTGKVVGEKTRGGTLSYLVGQAYIKEQPNNKARWTTWKSSTSLICYQGR